MAVDIALNPRVAALKPSKTMALTDLATRLKEEGRDIIGLAAGLRRLLQLSRCLISGALHAQLCMSCGTTI